MSPWTATRGADGEVLVTNATTSGLDPQKFDKTCLIIIINPSQKFYKIIFDFYELFYFQLLQKFDKVLIKTSQKNNKFSQ